MRVPRRELGWVVGLFLAASLLAVPERAGAESRFARAGSALSQFFRRVARILVPGSPSDADLDRALDAYAQGNYYTTVLYATRLKSKQAEELRDEADLLAGLAAAAAGLRDEAVRALESVLEAPRVSPYYPVALAGLLELESRLGNSRAAANEAARYLGDFWQRPRSPREATIKGVFLETGNLSAIVEPPETARDEGETTARPEDRPADRAVYLAGLALLGEKEFRGAAACFGALTPQSPYYAYARYGLGQADYALERYARAEAVLARLASRGARHTGERFLRERAALLSAAMLHAIGEDSAAIGWLRLIPRDGPFALHAVLLAAEIHADRNEPALALVYLQDGPDGSAEPKLTARAAAFDAELHRALRDTDTAIARLETGLHVLEEYRGSLESGAGHGIETLLQSLERRQQARDGVEAWRRENVANAVPDLLTASFEPGWLSAQIASWASSGSAESGYPVIYYPKRYDPFTALPLPRDYAFEPPVDHAFPILFRRSLDHALNEALRFEHQLGRSLENADDTQLALLLLDGEIRLAAGSKQNDPPVDRSAMEALGLAAEVSSAVADGRPRAEVLAAALRSAQIEGTEGRDPQRHARLLAAGRGQLERWREYERSLVRHAVRDEVKTVEDLRYSLEFDLSQTLAVKKDEEQHLLRQGSVSGPPES